jgi:SRSO17 transposase
LPLERIEALAEQLREHWARFHDCFATQTRDTSEHAYHYLRGQLTMQTERTYAGIARTLDGSDGQAMQHFMSNSPWSSQSVYRQIQAEICATPQLAQGSLLILDESADEKAAVKSGGAARQYNGRFGKVDSCQVAVVLGYANWHSGPWTTWALVDSELFLPEAWFTPTMTVLRHKLGVPSERRFASKPALGLQLIRRAQAQGLPFEAVACDDLDGRDSGFRTRLDQEGILYVADVPAHQQLYLEQPQIGVPNRAARTGRPKSKLRILNGVKPSRVDLVARRPDLSWQRLLIRAPERGVLADDFSARRVWSWRKDERQVREEWLLIRIERNGDHTYTLSNAPLDTPLLRLADWSCGRYFVERTLQAAKDEPGWDEFQAQKYRGWEHHTALTACALWFIAQTKLTWAEDCGRDPHLLAQLEVQLLPALSTANVRAMLKSVLPLPQLSPEQAQAQIIKHLVNRSRSTASRLRRSQSNQLAAPP